MALNRPLEEKNLPEDKSPYQPQQLPSGLVFTAAECRSYCEVRR
jgi:hypothetical protein